MMLRRSLSLLLCAVLAFSLCTFALPETALANEIHTGVFVGGTEINRNAYYVNDGAGGITTYGADDSNYNVHYTADGTLTLKDAFITNNHQWNENLYGTNYNRTVAIFASSTSLTINLEGHSIVRGADISADNSNVLLISAGIYVRNDTLAIAGAGTLIATGGSASGREAESYGMYGSSVNISGGTLIATGGSASGWQARSYGVNGIHVNISGGTVTATGGSVSGDDAHSYGVNGGNVNISGGTITATGGSSEFASYGIYGGDSTGTATNITGGMITATGGSAKLSYGVNCRSDFRIDNGTLIATGGLVSEEDGESNGVHAAGVSDVVTQISGGLLVARAGNNASSAIYQVDEDYIKSSIAASYTPLISFNTDSVETFVVYGSPATFSATTTSIDCTATTPTLPANGATWDSGTKTLTLNNLIIAVDSNQDPAIRLPDGATLAFTGTNVACGGNSNFSCGVESIGSFTVNGSGNLIALGGAANTDISFGMCGNDVTFVSGQITAIGGTADRSSCGVQGTNVSMMNSGAALTAIGGTANSTSCGMVGIDTAIQSGSLTAIGGTADRSSSGITGNVILSGDAPKLASIGGTASYSYGTDGALTVSGAEPELVTLGGTASVDSVGVGCDYQIGRFTVSGTAPMITAIGGTASGSYGVNTNSTDIKLSSGYIQSFGNSMAFNQAPDMTDYRSYYWTASGTTLQKGEFPHVSYPYLASHKYVSFAPGSIPSPTVDSVTVSPTTASATNGSSVDFTATVTGQHEPPQAIIWTVSGCTSDSTTFNANGRLTIDADERSSTMTVKAASKLDPSKSATATVSLTITMPPSSGGGSSGGGSSDVTVYNNPSRPNATVWLTGSGLDNSDLLITEREPQGSAYNALLRLANSGDVFNTYNISLRSGKKSTGSAMYLTFDLDSKYAGQAFTLVHQKADGSYEYFYDTADYFGDLTFGPLYELSPFMLVRGKLAQTTYANLADLPKTGDSAQIALWTSVVLLMAAASLAGVSLRKRRD